MRRSGQVSGAERLVTVMFVESMAARAELLLVLCLNSSWTEDTRSCIFSDTALHPGKDGQKPLAAELDVQIEQKFEEFEVLVTKGKNLLDKDHHLTQMVSRVLLYIYHGLLFSFSNSDLFTGKRAHGGAAEHAGLDHRALEGSETTVASQEEQRRGFTR